MCSLIIVGATIYASIALADNSRQWLVVPGRTGAQAQRIQIREINGAAWTLGSPRQRRQNACPAARALMERGEVVLLVRRVHAVIVKREADHDRVHAEHALEVADDRDRAAL